MLYNVRLEKTQRTRIFFLKKTDQYISINVIVKIDCCQPSGRYVYAVPYEQVSIRGIVQVEFGAQLPSGIVLIRLAIPKQTLIVLKCRFYRNKERFKLVISYMAPGHHGASPSSCSVCSVSLSIHNRHDSSRPLVASSPRSYISARDRCASASPWLAASL